MRGVRALVGGDRDAAAHQLGELFDDAEAEARAHLPTARHRRHLAARAKASVRAQSDASEQLALRACCGTVGMGWRCCLA